MEVTGVFSSCVTAFRKLSCCSLRRISRTRKTVFSTTPAMMNAKKMIPRTRAPTSRHFRTIQLTLSAMATPIRQAPRVMKKAIVLVRLGDAHHRRLL